MRGIDDARGDIDLVDEDVLKLLVKRKDLVKEVRELKKNSGMEVYQKEREEEMAEKRKRLSLELGLDEEVVERIFQVIIQYSKDIQGNYK